MVHVKTDNKLMCLVTFLSLKTNVNLILYFVKPFLTDQALLNFKKIQFEASSKRFVRLSPYTL